MVKKIALFLIFFCYSPAVLASFWDGVANCFTDPCNCGVSDKTRWENWNGQRLNKGNKNSTCPPWNKENGRNDNTCLVKAAFPGAFIGYYENLCGEDTPESSYFEPKIRVRGQQCNAFACWTSVNTLSWDGQCVTLVGGYVFPLHRMCARVAVPADPERNISQDPGYTYGQHLNWEGATEDDDPIITSDGGSIILESPKLCLYKDPSFFSTTDGFDVMDLDPHKQSFHKTSDIHPVVRAILFFVDNASTFAQSPFTLLASLSSSLSNGDDAETTIGAILNDIFSFLGNVIKWVGQLIIDFLKQIGQINRTVDSTIYGCVNLPMGPYPPPYCETVTPFLQVARTQRICSIGEDGLPVLSLQGQECVVSTLRNNYVNNSVRVGYESFVPLCQYGEDPMTTDKCVVIDNLGSFASATGLHATTARRDVIRPCATAAAGAPCVRTMLPHNCSVSSNGCNDGFRVIYSTIVGSVVLAQPYFRDDLDDCPSATSATCQKIWGINTGEFVDKSLKFDTIQAAYDITPLATSFTLVDKSNRTAYFDASIVRIAGFNSTYGFTQEPNQICVFEGDFVVGCEARASAPKPSIYNCGTSVVPAPSCTSTYFTPAFIVSYISTYKSGPNPTDISSDSTSTVIEPASVYNISSVDTLANLAGDEFESFVTDDTFNVKPFSGSNSPNPSSIFGVYKNNILPVSGTTINQNAVYISGLEYINDKYHLGGKYACLSSPNASKCPDNPKLCVLAKLLNKDIVKCSIFSSKAATQGGFSLCSSTQTTACTAIDSMPKITGGTVAIRLCADGTKCYDGTVELCKLSNLSSDRVDPSANLGSALSDSQYYNSSASSGYPTSPTSVALNYDSDSYGLRDKTSVELGLCADVPQPICPAVTSASAATGNATWTAAAVSQTSIGTCASGLAAPSLPITRFCLANSTTQQVSLEPITSSTTCTQLLPTHCEAVTVLPDGGYQRRYSFATWPRTPVGQQATGTCAPQFVSGTIVAPVSTITAFDNPLYITFLFSNITQPQYAAWTGTTITTSCTINPVTLVAEFVQLDPIYYGCYIKNIFSPYFTSMIVPGVYIYYPSNYYSY